LKSLNIVGCGKVGQTLAHLWHHSGAFTIQDVLTTSEKSAREACDFAGAGTVVQTVAAMRPADVWLSGVQDAHIASIAVTLATTYGLQGPNLAISGSGDVFGVRYTHNLDSSADWQHKVNMGVENRAYGNSVKATGAGGASLVPSLSTRPLTMGYTGNYRAPARETALNLTWLLNLPGGTNGTEADFNQAGGRTGAKGNFQTLKFGNQAGGRSGR
jgi:hypothetical protein